MGVILVFSTAMARPGARNPVKFALRLIGRLKSQFEIDAGDPNLQQSIIMREYALARPQHSVIIR